MPGHLFPGLPRWSPLRWALIGYLILATAVVWALLSVRAQVHANTKSTQALCTLKEARKDELRDSKLALLRTRDFLRRFPEGFDGFTTDELRAAVNRAVDDRNDNQAVVDALSILECPDKEEP